MEAMVKKGSRKEKTKEESKELGVLAQKVYSSVAQLLHPSHRLFGHRVKEMGKRLVAGVKMQKTGGQFAPGRMTFVFDMEMAKNTETPLVTYRAKEDCPKVIKG